MKKRILFIIWSYSYGGGAEKILSQLVNNMDSDKYEIAIQEFYHADIKLEKTNDNIKILPPIIDENKTNKILRKIYNVCIFLFPSLLRKKIPNDYDIEIAFNYQIPTFLLHKNKKSICWVHGAPIDLKSSIFKKYLQKKVYNRTDAIVSIANLTKDTLTELFPNLTDKMISIYNGYDFKLMDNQSKEESNIIIEENSLLFCGRLTDEKNPMDLLIVMKKLLEKMDNVHLYLVGEGNLKENLQIKSKEMGISDKIHVLGYIKNPYPIITKTKALVLLSKGEGFPTVFVEGMYFGKPFVSSYVGGCDELSFGDKNGFVVNGVDDCVNRLYQLLSDDHLYNAMSQSCKDYIRQYSIDNQVKQTEMLIDSILSGDYKD